MTKAYLNCSLKVPAKINKTLSALLHNDYIKISFLQPEFSALFSILFVLLKQLRKYSNGNTIKSPLDFQKVTDFTLYIDF